MAEIARFRCGKWHSLKQAVNVDNMINRAFKFDLMVIGVHRSILPEAPETLSGCPVILLFLAQGLRDKATRRLPLGIEWPRRRFLWIRWQSW